jgi:hypothetical protein
VPSIFFLFGILEGLEELKIILVVESKARV